MAKASRTIRVETLARVEGEGALHLKITGGRVERAELNIYEPPRFFEALLRGRRFDEAPDITARICGICPVAYQMSAVQAMEGALGIEIEGPVRGLRRLFYCGEWIESHALHIYLLHAPDFLGYESAIALARDQAEIVQRGLRLKKIGNQIVTLLGGREIHPINVRIGGFYRVPTRCELRTLVEDLRWAADTSHETVRLVAGFEFPDFEPEHEYVALRHPAEYPFNEGRIVSTRGLDIPVEDYEANFVEEHVEHSTALHSRRVGAGSYFVGPLARYNLNADLLAPRAREAAAEAGLVAPCRNPFRSIVVRAVETLHACEEALRLIEDYEPPERPFVPAEPRAGTGYGCTEAPRGMLYHRYRLDDQGSILEARIVPPTSQNQKSIEEDLANFAQAHVDLPAAELQWRCEQAIRNYDPCISCATHFLKLSVERS